MHCDPLDFDKIVRALTNTYNEVQTEELSNAKQNCLEAYSYATNIDPQYLKYKME